jgi:hypothetical protein
VQGPFDTRSPIADPWPMQRVRPLLLPLGVLVLGFGAACEAPTDKASRQAQPPVIVVQAPPEQPATEGGAAAGSEGATTGYAGLTWQAVNHNEPSANPDPNSEPYDVVALLREFDPQLTDPPNDAQGDGGHDDLLSALAVMDAEYLYARVDRHDEALLGLRLPDLLHRRGAEHALRRRGGRAGGVARRGPRERSRDEVGAAPRGHATDRRAADLP